jgi:RNA polymerase sigma-70 factor (ECF subfamily)
MRAPVDYQCDLGKLVWLGRPRFGRRSALRLPLVVGTLASQLLILMPRYRFMPVVQPTSDGSTSASLLRRLRQSSNQPINQAAWNRFVRLYTPLLFYWARKAGFSEADASDLIQDVFCILIRKLPEFEYDATQSFRSWLRKVLVNASHNRRRRKAAEPRSDLDLLPPTAIVPDAIVELEEAEYRQVLVARVIELMKAEFEPKTWQACWQFVVGGRPAAEVAAELKISVNSVYLAKSRVLARLRRELEGLFD